MTDRTFFDTNVLVYLWDHDQPAKQATAERLVTQEVNSGLAVVSTQVLQEFYATVTRKLKPPLPDAEALANTESFATLPVVQVDPVLILKAIRLSQLHRISMWDALIVEAALAADCRRLLTEDLQNGRRFGELLIENPFAAT